MSRHDDYIYFSGEYPLYEIESITPESNIFVHPITDKTQSFYLIKRDLDKWDIWEFMTNDGTVIFLPENRIQFLGRFPSIYGTYDIIRKTYDITEKISTKRMYVISS